MPAVQGPSVDIHVDSFWRHKLNNYLITHLLRPENIVNSKRPILVIVMNH